MSETTYNGWSNYPTWCVDLWLSNDEPLYRQALALAEQARDDDGNVHRSHVAEELKTWVRDELAPDLGASFASDLLGFALDQVDWHEIADAWIEQVRED
jgi:hypothetical protein